MPNEEAITRILAVSTRASTVLDYPRDKGLERLTSIR
jgi:hypothetical protein